MLKPEMKLAEQLGSSSMALPKRRVEIDLTPASRVLSEPMVCHPNSPVEFHLLTHARRSARPGGGQGAAATSADVVRQVQPDIKSELHQAAEVGFCSHARVCPGCSCYTCVLHLDCHTCPAAAVAAAEGRLDFPVSQCCSQPKALQG